MIRKIKSGLSLSIILLKSSSSFQLFSHPTNLSIVSVKNYNTAIKMQKQKMLEVEQKFCTSNLDDVVQKLSELNFEPAKNEIKFTDWYFDHKELALCTKDCWLRYRHMSSDPEDGSWQLKKGRKGLQSKVTVYEELEGEEAINIVKAMLSEYSVSQGTENETCDSETMDGYEIPSIPINIANYDLKPFARIETKRSTWKKVSSYSSENIVVDLDGTDFGYTVGEVEIIVHNDEGIEEAQKVVKGLIGDITGNEKDGAQALGKLETYLIANRPDVYDACISSGSMKKMYN